MHFLRTGVDKRLDAYKTPHPAATGRGGVMCCTRVPQSGNSGVFCLVPEYTENFAGKAKKRQNCNGKRKMPSLVAGLQQQGQRGNRILNKTAERIIMRKKLKKEGRLHGTGISACTIQHSSCGFDERTRHASPAIRNAMMDMDTMRGAKGLALLSGLVKCGDCKESMVLKSPDTYSSMKR